MNGETLIIAAVTVLLVLAVFVSVRSGATINLNRDSMIVYRKDRPVLYWLGVVFLSVFALAGTAGLLDAQFHLFG
jgi:hypothetical protein